MLARITETRSIAALFCCLLALEPLASCGDSRAADLGEWSVMPARQIALPLAPGRVTVEVRDLDEGWIERVTVESDGARVTSGIPVEADRSPASLDVDDEAADFFRAAIGDAVPRASALERALAISVWCGRRVFGQEANGMAENRASDDALPIASEDGRQILASIDAGHQFNCRSVATVFADAARAEGLRVRRVDMTLRHDSPFEGHSAVEVWSPELAKWVLVDPWFGVRYEIDGAPASGFELHEAVVSRRLDAIRMIRPERVTGASPWHSKINPILYYRNLLVQLSGGAWLTRADDWTPPPPIAAVNLLVSGDDRAFTTDGDPLAVAPVARASVGDRLVYQAIGSTLYVCLAEGRYRPGRLEVRATRGLAVSPAPELRPHDPDDDLLVSPEELLSSTAPAAGEWGAEGGATVSRDGDAIVVETNDAEGAEGAAELRVPIAEPNPVVSFARVAVERGSARFGNRNRREGTFFPLSAATPSLASSTVSGTKKGFVTLRLELDRGSRARILWVSLRDVRRFEGGPRGRSR